MTGAVHALKNEHDGVMRHLLTTEPSLAVGLGSTLAKALVLAGASEIEVDVHQHLNDYFMDATGSNIEAVSFVTNKAMKRQYHTFFDWERPSANTFFGLFGDEFKRQVLVRIAGDVNLSGGVRAFLDLGALRNQIIHKDFAAFPMSQTADDIFALYERARIFVDLLPDLLRDTVTDANRALS